MLGGAHIQFPLERGRGSHKEQGNKVETFLQLILPVILYSDFCLAFLIQKLDARPGCHYETLSAGNFHSEGFFFFNRMRVRTAWNETLTLDIEGGVGGVQLLSCGSVSCHALKVSCVQPPIHGGELEVAALLEAPLAVFQGLAVVKPAVSDVGRIADLAAEHGAAAVQGILGLGLLGELDGGSLDGQNWNRERERERGKWMTRGLEWSCC